MRTEAKSPESYIDQLPDDRKQVMRELRATVLNNLPKGFKETLAYGMLAYVVPHQVYPSGYHADPKQPLPFLNLASQKNHIAVYHMGIYGSPELLTWFVSEYQKEYGSKPDIGKGCIRFKKPSMVPVSLIGQLVTKISVKDWIRIYENNRKA